MILPNRTLAGPVYLNSSLCSEFIHELLWLTYMCICRHVLVTSTTLNYPNVDYTFVARSRRIRKLQPGFRSTNAKLGTRKWFSKNETTDVLLTTLPIEWQIVYNDISTSVIYQRCLKAWKGPFTCLHICDKHPITSILQC